MFVPSNTVLFNKCYNATISFILKWPSLLDYSAVELLLKTLLHKFNTVVYFKMQIQDLQNELKALSKTFDYNFSTSDSLKEVCRYSLSNKVLTSLKSLFIDGNVFLPSLIDKFWDFTLKSLVIYMDWIDFMIL